MRQGFIIAPAFYHVLRQGVINTVISKEEVLVVKRSLLIMVNRLMIRGFERDLIIRL